jgi:hypothetical protein
MKRKTTVLSQEFVAVVAVLDEVGNLMFQDLIQHFESAEGKT